MTKTARRKRRDRLAQGIVDPVYVPNARERERCAGKARWNTFGGAEHYARVLLETKAQLRYPYRCRVCGRYHITSNPRSRRLYR